MDLPCLALLFYMQGESSDDHSAAYINGSGDIHIFFSQCTEIFIILRQNKIT
jgi:hypothetical protein